jgi:hypothetical protein
MLERESTGGVYMTELVNYEGEQAYQDAVSKRGVSHEEHKEFMRRMRIIKK